MAADVPCVEPLEIVAGDTAKWSKVLRDYSIADGWVLKYRLVGGTVNLTVTADASTGTWIVTILAADLTAITADTTCRLVGWVEQGAEKWTIYDDYCRVKANARTATADQLKSTAVKTLEVIDAALNGRLTSDIEEYQLNGRAVKKIGIKELQELRGAYVAIVWREQNPGASFPSHEVRFR